MDLENCREEQETRQKKTFPEDNNDLLVKTRESDPLEEKGRYEPYQAICLNAQNQALPTHSQEGYSLLMQMIFGFEMIIPVIHYILLKHILITLKSAFLCY